MSTIQTANSEISYLRWLAQQELEDVHTIRRETAERVLTEERMRIVQYLTEHEVTSVRDLARQLNRNVSAVSRDLDVLFEADVIDYEQNGRAKIPLLAHKNIFVKPVVFEGAVLPEEAQQDE
jgi:DNA-binding transcriptional ArsR family regulator